MKEIEHGPTFCFLKRDKENINLKILEKKDDKNSKKNTQKRTGSTCGHFQIPHLNRLLNEIKDDNKTLTGKNTICERISFFMRKKEKNDRNYIYFYGLDEYLELK